MLSRLFILCLFAGLVNGAAAHALEASAAGEVTAATAWMHGEADHDQVPADADRDYPHHHNSCHGHDVASSVKLIDAQLFFNMGKQGHARADDKPAPEPLKRTLRPPIA